MKKQTFEAVVILNKSGNLWSHKNFFNKREAKEYTKISVHKDDLKLMKFVYAKITVEPFRKVK